MVKHEQLDRLTMRKLRAGLYDHAQHMKLADQNIRRYLLFSFDFDSRSLNPEDPQQVDQLKLEYGDRNDKIAQDFHDLGVKSMSIIAHHNTIHEQARHAFVIGAYFPALVAACALGERILNHLVLDLRDYYKSSRHYKKVLRKSSFDDWGLMVEILEDWHVLVAGVGEKFLELA